MYLGLRDKWKTKESNEMSECIIETKSGATWNTFVELENIISEENFVTQYLGESGEWFAKKLEHSGAHDRDGFSDQEYLRITESLRHIAKRLLAHADEIERAK